MPAGHGEGFSNGDGLTIVQLDRARSERVHRQRPGTGPCRLLGFVHRSLMGADFGAAVEDHADQQKIATSSNTAKRSDPILDRSMGTERSHGPHWTDR